MFGRARKTNPAFRARISHGNGGIGRNRKANESDWPASPPTAIISDLCPPWYAAQFLAPASQRLSTWRS